MGTITYMNDQQRRALAHLCPQVRWNVSMASYSTFRTGGMVEALVEIESVAMLPALLRWLKEQQVRWHVVGGGSNILVSSGAHPGVCIRLRDTVRSAQIKSCQESSSTGLLVTVGAGCSLPAFVGWCAGKGLQGLEFMAGIPGSVGGAIRMNAGAFGHAVFEQLHAIQCVTGEGEVVEVAREEMFFRYRESRFPGEPAQRLVITGGTFILAPGSREQLQARIRELVLQRQQKQPAGAASAGSFFKNPEGDYAGRLIEQAGLKGLTRGKAMVSPVHANFIVNTGGAAPEDILELMREVRERVLEQTGILLEPEVHIL